MADELVKIEIAEEARLSEEGNGALIMQKAQQMREKKVATRRRHTVGQMEVKKV